ncbi:MAG TPA: hypothetical protein VFU69_19470 [Ktedonobacterales bacterium]|nr:hypothetical protein [Ktedonobacterales bacterium]
MNLDVLALLLEPVAWLGGAVTLAASLAVFWHYRSSQQASLNWYLGNWRMRQILAVSALFYLALAASCLILRDRWGWLYFLVAFRLGSWWYKRLLNERASFQQLLRSRSRA